MATEHFTDKELACRCGCGGLPSEEFQAELEGLRREYGRPMILTSAFRCPSHNAKVSARKTRNGPHTRGAVDVAVYHGHAQELADCAFRRGWRGFGWSQKGEHRKRFLHLDRRAERAVWSY